MTPASMTVNNCHEFYLQQKITVVVDHFSNLDEVTHQDLDVIFCLDQLNMSNICEVCIILATDFRD